MTTQRAIEIINPNNTTIDYTEQDMREACNMAVTALRGQDRADLNITFPKPIINPDLEQLHNKFIGEKERVKHGG